MAAQTLNFTQDNGSWIAEFTATNDYNLHIEVAEDAQRGVRVLQKGSSEQNYALAYEKFDDKAKQESETFDKDFKHGIYPKLIRIECVSQPAKAMLVMAEKSEDSKILAIMKNLPDGQAVSAQVAVNTANLAKSVTSSSGTLNDIL